MPFQIRNFFENDDVAVSGQMGAFRVAEWKRELSLTPSTAQEAYFAAKMDVRRRQLVCDLNQAAISLQTGIVQFMLGEVQMSMGSKGASDFIGKAFRGGSTGTSAVKPICQGMGLVVCEPTYKYIIFEDVNDWGNHITLDDSVFLAAYATLEQKATTKSGGMPGTNVGGNPGNEDGQLNLMFSGYGAVAMVSPAPREELIMIDIENDVLKVDSSLVLAWSSTLQFSTERSSKPLVGAPSPSESFVNVYRGTGRVLLTPTV